jgi:hypothetical protein
VVQVEGNSVKGDDPIVKASFEYAVAELGCRLIMVIGMRAAEIRTEMRDAVGPMLRCVLERAKATWSVDQALRLDRHEAPPWLLASGGLAPNHWFSTPVDHH